MIALLFASLLSVPAQLSLGSGSKLTLEGDSSMHAWSCKASALEGTGEAASLGAVASSVSSFELDLPVARIECGNDTMDGKLRDALKASRFPRIAFKVSSVASLPAAEGGTQKLKLSGRVEVAGVQKNVTAVVTVTPGPGNVVRAVASVPLKMTDFGVEPPSAMLGLLTTKDRIIVRVELEVVARGAAVHAAR